MNDSHSITLNGGHRIAAEKVHQMTLKLVFSPSIACGLSANEPAKVADEGLGWGLDFCCPPLNVALPHLNSNALNYSNISSSSATKNLGVLAFQFVFAHSAEYSRASAEPTFGGGHTGESCFTQRFSRASTLPFVPIQRHPPSFPPVNSAVKLQFVQFLPQMCVSPELKASR